MSRIVAGDWGGRRLVVPRSGVRPTSDRVREAMFNSLTVRLGDWQGRRVLDLFAGSGALGFEALSRGAESVVFVERDPAAVAVIRRNAAALGVGNRARIVSRDVTSAVRTAPDPEQCDVVFADPPYRDAEMLPAVLAAYAKAGWFGSGALLAVETGRRSQSPWGPEPGPLHGLDRREYGDTVVWYGRCDGTGTQSRPPSGHE